MKNIKYVFLGNSQTLKEIGDYPNAAQENWVRDAKSIFEKYCKTSSNKYEQRNRVSGQEGNFYFTISATNVFYLALVNPEYPERQVFELIDEIQKENIPILVDEKRELNKLGQNSLRDVIERYQNPKNNKIANINNELNDVKIEMKQNVKKAMTNMEDVQVLDDKASRIKDGAADFQRDATKLKKLTCMQNFKWTLILIVLVIGVLLVIILPIALSGKSSTNSSNTNNNSSTNNTNTATTDLKPAANNTNTTNKNTTLTVNNNTNPGSNNNQTTPSNSIAALAGINSTSPSPTNGTSVNNSTVPATNSTSNSNGTNTANNSTIPSSNSTTNTTGNNTSVNRTLI